MRALLLPVVMLACAETLANTPEPLTPTPMSDAATPTMDAAKDGQPPIGPTPDASVPADDCKLDGGARATLTKEFSEGVWYIKEGSAGSWFRMNITEANPQGSVIYRPITNPGYFPCKQGTGLGQVSNSNGEVVLQLPDGCANEGRTYRVLCLGPANQGGYAELAAIAIETRSGGATKRLRLVRYPTTYCSQDLTSCSQPD
jgi:hypothetical protein